MKKVFFNIFILAVLSLQAQSNLSAKQIWINYVDSFGDATQIRNIKTSYTKANVLVDTVKFTTEIYTRYPDKLRYTIENSSQKITYILNGDTGIFIFNDSISPLSKKDISNYKYMALVFPEFYYIDLGYTFDLMGIEVVDNKQYYKIKTHSPKQEEELIYYINTKDYTILKLIVDNQITTITEIAKIDGIRMVKSSEFNVDNNTMKMEKQIIKFNIEIDDTIFELK